MANDRDDYDSPWKDVLERGFPEFMAFYFPAAHGEIDWSRGYEVLDSELQQVVQTPSWAGAPPTSWSGSP